MQLEERLNQRKKAVEDFLDRLLSGEASSPLIQSMRHSVLSGGKRYRPLLLLSTGEYFQVKQGDSLPFACGLELIHNYSLIHDDLPSMDNDDYRRGQPACHKAYGEDIALLTGDSLLTLSFEVMAKAALGKGDKAAKMNIIHEISVSAGLQGMIGGQLLDITVSPDKLNEDILYDLMEKKTASLITAAVRAGALLGKASSQNLEALSEYGRNIGLAFQIRDDVLDSEQDRKGNLLLRPNAVLVLGQKKARTRLKEHIEASVRSLDDAGIESEDLRYLAFMLSV
ncbi:MAG: polyprenyl synthetase family protein [Candidatus Aminicenantes bacterium]|nr:polyprenyl synthetase family protein [Candidatus Aminicenantes bacterium]